jgi:hypothetical protein
METLESVPFEREDPFQPPAVLKELHGPLHPMTYADGRLGWLVTGYAEARAVLDDPRFSNTQQGAAPPIKELAPPEGLADLVIPPGFFIAMDDPEHSRYRRLLTGHFSMRKMRRLEPRIQITVFKPLTMYAKPTSRIGVIGIGGLGHMAVKFAAAYGCDVTAFTSSEGKFDEARGFGATHVVSSKDSSSIRKLAGSFDLLISTVNVPLDWEAVVNALAPTGRLHVVGVVPQPIPVTAFALVAGQRSVSGSPTGPPAAIAAMLDFAARHGIAPQTEHFPMSQVNEAFARLESGKARYRIVLDADL